MPISLVSGLLKLWTSASRKGHDHSPFATIIERSRHYAGIGSGKTPSSILTLMQQIAEALARRGWTLRSGGASGADRAFERGCDQGAGKKEIFLPWAQFNGHSSSLYHPTEEAEQIAALCHPNWQAFSTDTRKLRACNCQQIGGNTLGDPVDFVLFWAPEKDGIVRGGTATAITFARHLSIPVFNLQNNTVRRQWERFATQNKVPHVAVMMEKRQMNA